MQNRRNYWRHALLAAILLAGAIAGLFLYLNRNRSMTIDRNANYLEDAASQTAKRVDDLLVQAQNSISAIAYMYETSMDARQVDLELLEELAENTVFDYIGMVDANGVYTDNRGRSVNVSDRDYYRHGMTGGAGLSTVFNGRASGEDLVIFYAPLHYEGDVVGVLTGRYRQQQMRTLLASEYFGQPAATYLCLPDGTVISASVSEPPVNILEALNQHPNVDQDAMSRLARAMGSGESCSIAYSTDRGASAAYVTQLPHSSWMLLQLFPLKVTNDMLEEFHLSTIQLILFLAALFAAYILYLFLDNSRARAQLNVEKERMRDIVDRTSQLFNRLIVADLQTYTYEILKDDGLPDQLPHRGALNDFFQSWSHDRLHQEDEDRFSLGYIRSHLTPDVPYLQYEYRVRRNGLRWKQMFILCLSREGDTPLSILMAVQDVTEMKEAELRSQAALESACKSAQAANEAKRDFLFNMSHDMRTPMNAILGLSNLLDQSADDPEQVRSFNRKLQVSGRQLLNLINEVLDMSKIESGQLTLNTEAFVLSELLEELRTVLQPQSLEKEQSLSFQTEDSTPDHLLGDRLRICEILTNLLSNGVKYTPKGGHVSLTVRELPQVTPGYVRLCFQIQDDGIGMSPEFLPHIFEPFSRENNSTASGIQGTGLGMTITKSLVDLMGGSITVESTPGQGTTFRVELELRRGTQPAPAGPEVAESGGGAAPASPKPSLEGLHLLAAEDNDLNAEILMELLSLEGITCQRAVHGREAVELFQSGEPGCYDAILMDIQMPELNGYQATRAIRALDRPDAKTIPIIAMTANAFAEDVRRSLEAGMNEHIAKPVDMDVLTAALARWIGR